MMITLDNKLLKAKIHSQGAELQSLIKQDVQQEYIWKGDPQYWGRHAPVLFPIVGQLKDNTYYYKGKAYQLSRHGFARDREFEIAEQGGHEATLVLHSDEETKKIYPFDFIFKVHYLLEDYTLRVTYEVINPAEEDLYFSVGGHPAFAVPLEKGLEYADYYLRFEEAETMRRWLIEGGMISNDSELLLDNEAKLPLKKKLFYEDVLVLKNLKSKQVSLQTDKAEHGLHFHYEGFPYLGIWAAKDAPFVCIEPWCGIADSANHNQQLTDKEGIIRLAGGESWKHSWKVEFY